jgi:hypothetical protein
MPVGLVSVVGASNALGRGVPERIDRDGAPRCRHGVIDSSLAGRTMHGRGWATLEKGVRHASGLFAASYVRA